jgi:hypothetical protein
MSMPSGYGSETMPELERVMQLAYEHGYRVGLQIGKCGKIVIHIRDLALEHQPIVILGTDIEQCAAHLFLEILKRKYVPRGDVSRAGGAA